MPAEAAADLTARILLILHNNGLNTAAIDDGPHPTPDGPWRLTLSVDGSHSGIPFRPVGSCPHGGRTVDYQEASHPDAERFARMMLDLLRRTMPKILNVTATGYDEEVGAGTRVRFTAELHRNALSLPRDNQRVA